MNETPDLADLGLDAVVVDSLQRSHAELLARTLDVSNGARHDSTRGSDELSAGTLPLPWIWTFFTPTVATTGLRQDGHPAGSGGGPLAGLDRRMFIGGSLQSHGALRLDTETERRSRVISADRKQGSSGDFVIVDVEHAYIQRDETALVERQKLMYRAQPSEAVPAPGADVAAPEGIGARSTLRPDERLLFRYSALTFNTHRIHYDLPYATGVEGYPGLVVHGPLTATVLARLGEQHLGAPLSSFEFRATAPTFAGTDIHFVVEGSDGEAINLSAVRGDGAVVMTAQAA